MRKRVYILGFLLGLIVPSFGIFAGLQISTTLGNILAFPVIFVVFLTGNPFGTWDWGLAIFAAVFSIVLWTAMIAAIDSFVKK